MELFISYLIKSTVAAAILYLYYQLALKNKKFHSYNRFYLLFSLLLSLAAPFIRISAFSINDPDEKLPGGLVNIMNMPTEVKPDAFTGSDTAWLVIATVSCLLVAVLIAKIIFILRIKHNHKQTRMPGFTLIETNDSAAPFSFFRNLFWKSGLSFTDINGEKILKHELTHIQQKHSYDKLFMQTVCCVFWFNPFYWLMQKELNTIHEFIADSASVEEGDTASFAAMLLHAHNEGRYLSPSHPFYNSSIKRRLIMISSSNKTQFSYARRVLALPLSIFVFACLSASVKAQSENIQELPVITEVPQKTDTVPQENLKPKTVIGYKSPEKLVKEKRYVKEVPQLKEVRAEKLKEVPALKEKKAEEVRVVGYKKPMNSSDEKLKEVHVEKLKEVRLTKEDELKEITVVGHKKPMKTTDENLDQLTEKQKKLDKLPTKKQWDKASEEPLKVKVKELRPEKLKQEMKTKDGKDKELRKEIKELKMKTKQENTKELKFR